MNARIVVHDFVGHPFQVQLSRELAARGHHVLHLHFPQFETPKGRLEPAADDPPTLRIEGLRIAGRYGKYSIPRRLAGEWRYARACAAALREFRAEAMLSSNAPPHLQKWLRGACRRQGVAFVPWIQDLYGIGAEAVLRRKFGWFGRLPGLLLRHLDDSLVGGGGPVVFISADFERYFEHVAPPAERRWHVIENWAPLDELPPRPRRNPWSAAHELDGKRVLLYSGTLGLKHNPELLAALAERFRGTPGVVVAVVSQGLGRQWLERRKRELGLDNLRLFDFQPFECLPDVVASGDVLLAMVEPDAGEYSVPSKVLTYLCAARPIVLSIPAANLAARLATRQEAGLTVEPHDRAGFVRAAGRLLEDPALAARLAANARRYAESAFDIGRIGDRFERVIGEALAVRAGVRAPAAAAAS